ncbi:MAG: GNAT family N-acetyltransferase [Pseudomonadales bacterium]
MDDFDSYLAAISLQLAAARETGQRRMLVLAGDREWGNNVVQHVMDQKYFQKSLWVSDQKLSDQGLEQYGCIERQQARQLLGQDVDCLIYDTWAGLDPDVLAVVCGAIQGGGLLVLLTPLFEQWAAYADPDYQRMLVYPFKIEQIAGRFIKLFQQSILNARDLLLIEQDELIASDTLLSENIVSGLSTAEPSQKTFASMVTELTGVAGHQYCLSEDQADAVAGIVKVLKGHRRRPLVMTSDRGRGKSSALGIASAEIMQSGIYTIVMTAPRLESVRSVFEHATKVLQCASTKSSVLQFGDSTLRFIAPDELLRARPDADLVLVDEAAAIPAPLLEQYLKRYSRIVFSTTVHGYEGTGRGFDLRFRRILDTITPQWKTLQLSTPIRWAANDPVERWLFDALLLDAKAADDKSLAQATASHCVTEKLDRDPLLADEQSLGQLFGLLVLAHYQTTPTDLRNLLDGPNISVWVSRFQGAIVAAALVAEEGAFDTALSTAVWKGERRPRGHLLPQTLSAHSGLQQAPELSYQRIMRIAVHPAVQRRGLGLHLMTAIIEQAQKDQCDFIGSSFAATADVLRFWRGLHCVPVRLGVSRDASSGCFSAVVLSSLSHQGDALLDTARQRFNEQFPRELANLYQHLEPELVAELLRDTAAESVQLLNQQDWLDIEAFAKGYRQYEMCLLPLWKLVCMGFSKQQCVENLSASQHSLLIMRVLQNQPIKTVADALGLTGKKQLLVAMREAIKIIQSLAIH